MESDLLLIHILAFLIGAAVVIVTLLSAVRTFVVPRSEQDYLTRAVFLITLAFFRLAFTRARSYEERDRSMAFYAPIALLALPPVWLTFVLIGYTGMYWALGVPTWDEALRDSGSSLLTLGFAAGQGLPQTVLMFSEAAFGLMLVALLIAYLPTMYAAFQRREVAVTMLEVRAGSPPSAADMLERFHRIHGLARLSEMWERWEVWFAEVEESHTSLPALSFFRSPKSSRSWVTAAGAVLDAASLTRSTLDVPDDPRADLCIRAGYLALRHIADFYNFPYDPNPGPTDPISITREEFDSICERLASKGIPLKPDRDQAWRDFAGWRVNYDAVLLALADLTMAPFAPWSSDRSQGRARVRRARQR